MSYFIKSVFIALQNIRANPLHTFLSTLGIIIGVAALVGILALGDGLEQTGREQLAQTTSLNILQARTNQTKTVDNVRVRIEDAPRLKVEQARRIQSEYSKRAIVEFVANEATEISYGDSTHGIYFQGNMENGLSFINDSLASGRYITETDILNGEKVLVLGGYIAEKWFESPEEIIGKQVGIKGEQFVVIGLLKEQGEGTPRAYVPISTFLDIVDDYPVLSLKVTRAEEIPIVEEELKVWLDSEFEEGHGAFSLMSNRARVEQFSQGILLFKLIMGAITGISVLVGGIGVMNVLLISVTERTKEIGIRKATGAKKKDIVLQFMAESVTVSFVGCIAGWVVGILGIFIFVPIVNSIADMGFRAALGFNTVLIILAVAMVVGVVFGTYPAWRASQLDPIDAIRHE
ncbi:MAG: ABC transporter permease [Balneola sp.]|nr:MAG: ABC transporter permease [Balneola sp.]